MKYLVIILAATSIISAVPIHKAGNLQISKSQRLVSSNVDFDLEEKEMMTTGKTTTHAPKTIVTTQFPNTNQGGTSGSWLPNNKVSINLDFETNNIEHTDSVTTSVPKTTMSLSTAKSSKPEIDTTVGSTPTTAPATMSTMTTGDQPAISVTNPQEDNQKTTTGSNIDSSKPGVEPSSDGTITTTVSSPTSTMSTTEHITREPTAPEKADSPATSTATMDKHAETTSPVSINVDHSDASHTDSASMPSSIETNNKADGVTQSSSSVIAEIGTHCNATAEEPADKNEPIPIEIDRNENDLAPKDDVTTIANEAAVENEPNNQKETSTQPNVLDQIAESCGETKKKCETTTSIPVEIQESNENVAITTIKPTNEATQMFNVIKEAIEETSSVPLISSTIGSLPNTAREKGNQDDGSVSPTDETSTVDPENDSKMFRGSISVIVPLLFIILISNSLN